MNNIRLSKIQFSNEEISFLQQKKNISVLSLIGYVIVLGFGYFFYAADIADFTFAVTYAAIITSIFGALIFREAKKISRISSDLRGNFKIVFEAEIEDCKHADEIRERGENLSSKYFLVVRGEKYRVKAEHYFRFGRGDTVRMTVSPACKYAFDVEKIHGEKKSVSDDTLFRFTAPLYRKPKIGGKIL